MLWKHVTTGPGLGGIAATDAGMVVYGSRDLADQQDIFTCLNAHDGSIRWRVTYPAPGQLDYGNSPRATPLITERHVFVFGAMGDLHCIELAKGEVVWSRNLRTDYESTEELPWGTCGSPLLVDGRLIVHPGTPEALVVALDPDTGRELWRAPGDIAAYGSFVAGTLGGKPQIVGHDRTALVGIHASTGEPLWRRTPEVPDDFNVPTPIVHEGRLIICSENNGTRLLQFHSDGTPKDREVSVSAELAPDIATPVIVGDRLFGTWGELFCLDLQDGLRTTWQWSDPAIRTHASLIASPSRLLVAAANGELLLFDALADPPQLVSRSVVFPPDSELYSHPAVVGYRLYWRGENELCCLEFVQTPEGNP